MNTSSRRSSKTRIPTSQKTRQIQDSVRRPRQFDAIGELAGGKKKITRKLDTTNARTVRGY